uniref:Mesencephalic astrocyte-derived neurotrophic factor homolog n=1 Tax=Echinostoma caproni TaxID=27848 RepID=A0A183BBW3_9TREM
LEESAAKTVNALVLPITMHKPAEKVCEDLKKTVTDICDLRYEKTLDLKTFDFEKAKVKELRDILRSWDIKCVGCVERSDFYNFVMENLPKYDPQAAAAYEAKKEL